MKPHPYDSGHHLILGVTGGIASGKTTVARLLEELGVPQIDFDVLAREVVKVGQPALNKIAEQFGSGILTPRGSLDRSHLAQIVFNDDKRRKQLERIIHPYIHELYREKLRELTRRPDSVIIQAVVPLLIESSLQPLCDKILLVYVPPEIQIQRLIRRDRLTLQEARGRLQAQLPIDDKLSQADYIIINDQSLEHTRLQAKNLWRSLQTLLSATRMQPR